MATLQELLDFKEYWENRKEQAEDAIKFYDGEITKKVHDIAKGEYSKGKTNA